MCAAFNGINPNSLVTLPLVNALTTASLPVEVFGGFSETAFSGGRVVQPFQSPADAILHQTLLLADGLPSEMLERRSASVRATVGGDDVVVPSERKYLAARGGSANASSLPDEQDMSTEVNPKDPLGIKSGKPLCKHGPCQFDSAFIRPFYNDRWIRNLLCQDESVFRDAISDLFTLDPIILRYFHRHDFGSRVWIAIQEIYFPNSGRSKMDIEMSALLNVIRNATWLVGETSRRGYPMVNTVIDRIGSLIEHVLIVNDSKRLKANFLKAWPAPLTAQVFKFLRATPEEARTTLFLASETGTFPDLIKGMDDIAELKSLIHWLVVYAYDRLPELEPLLETRFEELSSAMADRASGSKEIGFVMDHHPLEALRIALGKAEPAWCDIDKRGVDYALIALVTLFDRDPSEALEIIDHQIGTDRFMAILNDNNVEPVSGPLYHLEQLKGIPIEALPPEHLAGFTCGLLAMIRLLELAREPKVKGDKALALRVGRKGKGRALSQDPYAEYIRFLRQVVKFRVLNGGLLNRNAKPYWIVDADCRKFVENLTDTAIEIFVSASLTDIVALVYAAVGKPKASDADEHSKWFVLMRAIVEQGFLPYVDGVTIPRGGMIWTPPMSIMETMGLKDPRPAVYLPLFRFVAPAVLQWEKEHPGRVADDRLEHLERMLRELNDAEGVADDGENGRKQLKK